MYTLSNRNEAHRGKSVKELLPLELQAELGFFFFSSGELGLAEEMRIFKRTCSLKITHPANLSSYTKNQMGFGSKFRQSVLY